MSGLLKGKVAVITGAGGEIARHVALLFAREGAQVVGCDIDAESAAETVDLVRGAGCEMEALYPLDLTVEDNARQLTEFAADRYGGIDVLYNGAMQMRIGTIEDLELEDWQSTLENTLTLSYLVTKHAIPHLRRGGGSIVFAGSFTGAESGAGHGDEMSFLLPYACAKAGVLRMAVVLANELADSGVRVNAISPGTVEAETALAFYGGPGGKRRRVAELGTLVRKLGDPEEIAQGVLYLSSELSPWVTGHNLIVSGGFVASGEEAPSPDSRAVIAPIVNEFSVSDESVRIREPRPAI